MSEVARREAISIVVPCYNEVAVFPYLQKELLYRSTVFWTHSATTSCCRSQQAALLMSDLGGRFVSMPSNQPGLIVSTLKLA